MEEHEGEGGGAEEGLVQAFISSTKFLEKTVCCVRGYLQTPNIYFNPSSLYSLVSSHEFLRILLSVAASEDLIIEVGRGCRERISLRRYLLPRLYCTTQGLHGNSTSSGLGLTTIEVHLRSEGSQIHMGLSLGHGSHKMGIQTLLH